MPEFQVNTNFNYSVKVPAELRGGPQYASEEFGGSVTIGQTVEAESVTAAKIYGEQLVPVLANQVKTAVLVQAGLDQITDENGVIQPVLQATVVARPQLEQRLPLPQQAVQAAPVAQPMQPMAAGGGGDGWPANPNAAAGRAGFDAQGQPMWMGRSVKVYDNRVVDANGQVFGPQGNKPWINIKFLDVDDSAPTNVKYQGFWQNNKDGSVSAMYREVLKLVASPAQAGYTQQQAGDYGPEEEPF